MKYIKIETTVTYQDETLDECVVIIDTIMSGDILGLNSFCKVGIYRSLEVFVKNADWTINIEEMTNDLELILSFPISEDSIYQLLKNKIVSLNENFNESNILIESS